MLYPRPIPLSGWTLTIPDEEGQLEINFGVIVAKPGNDKPTITFTCRAGPLRGKTIIRDSMSGLLAEVLVMANSVKRVIREKADRAYDADAGR